MNIRTGALISAVAVTMLAGIAQADTMMMASSSAMQGGDHMMKQSLMMMHAPRPVVVTIGADGSATLRGNVTAVSGNTITLSTWGGSWSVTLESNATVANGSVSDIAVGDFVGVLGTVSEDSPMVTATYVRDWSKNTSAMMMHADSMMH